MFRCRRLAEGRNERPFGSAFHLPAVSWRSEFFRATGWAVPRFCLDWRDERSDEFGPGR